jgi:polar amino acid transport system substrate-binding protein
MANRKRVFQVNSFIFYSGVDMLSASNHSATVARALATKGTLRAAINYGNPILASKSNDTGLPVGVSVDLARELAERLSVPLELITYPAAGKVVDAVVRDEWDIAFLAIDPERGLEIDYTDAYMTIEGSYAVRDNATIKTNEEVDREGVRVVVGAGSAYDLYLSRNLKNATIVRASTSQAVTETMMENSFEVAAGVRQQLQGDLQKFPELRLLDGRFMAIHQAMALPKNKGVAVDYLREFIKEMKISEFVLDALTRHQINGAVIAP